MSIRRLFVIALTLSLAGCTAMQPEEFAGTTPEFRLEEYFLGQTRAWGIVQDRSGRPKRFFTVDIQGSRQDEDVVLTEDFVFRDGETSQRIWRIRKTGPHSYEGSAGDIVGTATGHQAGNALNWRYDLLIDVKDKQWKIHFNDWMFLHEDGVVVNRAVMSKFGFKVGEILIFFKKT